MQKTITKRQSKRSESEMEVFHRFKEEDAREEALTAVNRRNFLKLSGFALGAASLSGCRMSVEKAIPYLNQPEEVIPGRATWYATTCGACSAGCGILSRNREGRPVKLEGNPEHPISQGGLCAMSQASIVELYDSQALSGPILEGKAENWEKVDQFILSALEKIKSSSQNSIRFLTRTVTSPTLNKSIDQFLTHFGGGLHIQFEGLSGSAILEVHEEMLGVRALPHYRFAKAKTIVSFDADFLSTHISPVEFTKDYTSRRILSKPGDFMSRHIQIESRLSLTGSKADSRYLVEPQKLGLATMQVAKEVLKRLEDPLAASIRAESVLSSAVVSEISKELIAHQGESLLLSGVNDPAIQRWLLLLNHRLGNYQSTLQLSEPSFQVQGRDQDMLVLLTDMEAGRVKALFISGANPLYDYPDVTRMANALSKVDLIVDFSGHVTETGKTAHALCPDHHFLAAWMDYEPVAGLVAIAQPMIRPFKNTRSVLTSLATWMGSEISEREVIRRYWQEAIFPRTDQTLGFEVFWNQTVHDGFAQVAVEAKAFGELLTGSIAMPQTFKTLSGNQLALNLYTTAAMRDGRGAHNPFLQELPDPITKTVWGNVALLSPAKAAELGLKNGEVVEISLKNRSIQLPILVQAGQEDHTLAVALGYGRLGTDRFAKVGPAWFEGKPTVQEGEAVGINAAPLVQYSGAHFLYSAIPVTVTKTGECAVLAVTQDHHRLTVPDNLAGATNPERPIALAMTYAEYSKGHGKAQHEPFERDEDGLPKSLWNRDHTYPNHHWGMSVDLSRCTGCAACVVACQIENNVPVVGKDEVARHREMTWLRIDRYYSKDGEDTTVAHQPMMCQQCGSAPCETVCPVLATVHSSEGLNQQVYNRCVGTRYCANNCPYKVRRFNWFTYARADEMQNLMLNPDVTIRERGVMEKCTFCVQRIQEGKYEAKRKEVSLADGDIKPACAQSCPAGAIVFGDMNDRQSLVSKNMRDARAYRVLEEINTRPATSYLQIVRNRNEVEAISPGSSEHSGSGEHKEATHG